MNKVLFFFTQGYYVLVRLTNSTYFFDLLYRLLKDPFQINQSCYEMKKFNKMLESIPPGDYRHCLDIGCGTGVLTSKILSISSKVTGIDLSPRAINVARHKYKQESRLTFISADICSYQSDSSYDLFICSEVLYYLQPKELTKAIQQIKKLTDKRGVLVFVGRADDNYVSRQLEKYFSLIDKFICPAQFTYRGLGLNISRPFGIFIYRISNRGVDADLSIRFYKSRDYTQLIRLWKQCKLPLKPKGRDSREELDRQSKLSTSIFLVAYTGEELAGSVFATDDGRKGWINRLAVNKKYRKRGIASKLLKTAENKLAEKGIKMNACLIESDNLNSKLFFKERGYREVKGISYFTKKKNRDI
ncbi:MAG: hypothetical protein APR63_10255 [Desulfuromonas sp. SDB]|nr:MAG: hypothetical protein APR63_10255 [Desulfuromonas sp. SDB]